ncbi:MAG TPA: lyase family protein [Saprospiraceae bacterium]|nr:lyase family protein [Saprospiraceae bacterium]
MKFRIEKDTMGAVEVPSDKYWGAQTERSRNNFKIGPEASMPKEIIYAFAYLKKAAAHANCDLKVLSAEKRDMISKVCDEILDKKLSRPDGSSKLLIRFVTDRPGHDKRYAIDATKLQNELQWSPSMNIKDGLEQTVDWYLSNEIWLNEVTSGAYKNYYQKHYSK